MARREAVTAAEDPITVAANKIVTKVADDSVQELLDFREADRAYAGFIEKHQGIVDKLRDLSTTRNLALNAVYEALRTNLQATETFPLARTPSLQLDVDQLIDWVRTSNRRRVKRGLPEVPLEDYGIVLKAPEYKIDREQLYKAVAVGAIPSEVALHGAKPVVAYAQLERTSIPDGLGKDKK